MRSEEIDLYISRFPGKIRNLLENVRQTIADHAPGAEEAMRYQIPTFRLKHKNLLHFAGYKNHIGFYPTPSGIKKFEDQLSEFETAKGSVKFPVNRLVPYGLIAKIVQFRVREINEYVRK